MADMELVIKIPEEKYKWICKNNPNATDDMIVGAIVHGTPLPKGHGRVIDLKMKKLEKIRNFIIDGVMREPAYMFSEKIRGTTDDDIDLIEIIASLYEELHREVMGEPYDYMFHWANKCGSWVESDLFEKGDFDV